LIAGDGGYGRLIAETTTSTIMGFDYMGWGVIK